MHALFELPVKVLETNLAVRNYFLERFPQLKKNYVPGSKHYHHGWDEIENGTYIVELRQEPKLEIPLCACLIGQKRLQSMKWLLKRYPHVYTPAMLQKSLSMCFPEQYYVM